MSADQINILKRALDREKQARKEAEKTLEVKSKELYLLTQKLEASNAKLEKLIKEKTTELKGVFENIVDAYIVTDLTGSVIKMNDAAVQLLGYNVKESEFNLLDITPKADVNRVMYSVKKLLSKGAITDFEIKIKTKKNESKLIHVNASTVINELGKPVAIQGIYRDITRERENAERLIQSESRLSSLILNLDSGVLLEDENRKIVLTNKKFCDFFKIPASPEQLIGADCSSSAEQSKHLFENPEVFVSDIDVILKERKEVLAQELKTVDGVIYERDYIPIYINNDYKGHLWSYRDVTLNRQYRNTIEAQRKRYSAIIANMNLGLIEVDNNDVILMVNHSFEEMSGYSQQELLGKKGKEIFLSDKESHIIQNENIKRQKGISNSYELKVKNKSGDTRYWLISGAPNYNIKGDVIGSIGIHLDITDLKRLQLQKEKLLNELEKSNDELQEYAHVVSHDLKSPLRSIYALISWIKEDNKGKFDEGSLENFTHIENSLEKMEQLITTVLNYSKVGVNNNDFESVDIDDKIKDLLMYLYIPKHIKIKVLNKLPVVMGDRVKLRQVFQNLIGNAIKYMDKEEGLIEIDVEDLEDRFKFIIRDNGMGIEKIYHEKIFKMFQSLHDNKDSTGIGLSIVKRIVNLHGGDIWLESQLGKGSAFYFTLKK